MAGCWTGTRPLPDPVMTQLNVFGWVEQILMPHVFEIVYFFKENE